MRFATLFASVLIIIAVLIPGSNLPDVGMGGVDKLVHIGMFAVWAVAVRYDLRGKKFRYLLVFAAGILFSAFSELLQLAVEDRSFDPYDIAADVLGLLLGLATGKPVIRWVDNLR